MSIAKQVLTPAQAKEAKAFFADNARGYTKGAKKWAAIREMFIIAGVVILELKTDLASLNRQVWLEAAARDKGSELDVNEQRRVKNVANADFSRGIVDPEEKERKAQQATEKKAADALAVKQAIADAAKQTGKEEATATMAQIAAMPGPSVIRGVEGVRDTLQRVQADLMAFQTAFSKARVPVQEKQALGEEIGTISQQVAEAINEVAEVLKSMQ